MSWASRRRERRNAAGPEFERGSICAAFHLPSGTLKILNDELHHLDPADPRPYRAHHSPCRTFHIALRDLSECVARAVPAARRPATRPFLVGGCVRDLLIGITPKDFDIATSALPEEVKRTFRNCRLIGRRFRLAHVFFGREIIEVATFRAMSAVTSTRCPTELAVADLDDDELATVVDDDLDDEDRRGRREHGAGRGGPHQTGLPSPLAAASSATVRATPARAMATMTTRTASPTNMAASCATTPTAPSTTTSGAATSPPTRCTTTSPTSRSGTTRAASRTSPRAG